MSHTIIQPKTAGPLRVVVVDDSLAVLESLCGFFAKMPAVLVVATAGDGRDAVAQVSEHRPDLVVMDVQMPRMNGFEAARAMREYLPEIRIILVSIDQDARRGEECLRHGADGFIPKIGMQRKLAGEVQRLFPQRHAEIETCKPSIYGSKN